VNFFRQLPLLCIGLSCIMTTLTHAEEIDVWLGTSSAKPSQGIYHCTLNTENGKLSESTLAAKMDGPGFLTMHPKANVMYAVGGWEGKPSVVAFAVDYAGGKPQLKPINALEIGDGGAAHVSVDATAQTLLTAQYGGGSVGVFSLNADGSLKQRTQLHEHTGGSGVVANRQDASHAHWTGFSPDNRFAFVPDLGLDKVVIYKVNAAESHLEPHGAGEVPPGAGPRHMKFHNNGKWIYVLNELDLTISLFDYDATAGRMTIRQTIPTVAKTELAKEQFTSASEIRVHPSGNFVVSANRGHDTLSVFAVNPEDGQLKPIEIEHIRGATPRNFSFDPSGKWLLAAGQDSHTLACFVCNSSTGELTYNRSIIHTPAPICVLFGK